MGGELFAGVQVLRFTSSAFRIQKPCITPSFVLEPSFTPYPNICFPVDEGQDLAWADIWAQVTPCASKVSNDVVGHGVVGS
jgi:hypothetical protein